MRFRRGNVVGWIGFGLIAMDAALCNLRVPAAEVESAPKPATAPSNAPVPPSEAANRITVPPGFRVTLFAAEPDVVQPIAFTIDHRGRLWVVENYSYPIWLGRAAAARTAS